MTALMKKAKLYYKHIIYSGIKTIMQFGALWLLSEKCMCGMKARTHECEIKLFFQ